MWRLITWVGMVCLLASVPGPAEAQDNPAKEHYMQGVALFEAGNYKAALVEFIESYDARPNWKLKHTIAICYFNMNRFVDAKRELDFYIAEGGKDISADKKAEVEEMLLQISKLTAQVEIEANVDGATIWIDDEKMATTPMNKPLVLDSGLYELEITAPGYVKYKRDLKLVGGDKKVYDISLKSKGGGEVEPVPDKKPDKKPKKKPKKKKKKKAKKPKVPASKQKKMAIGFLAGGGGAFAIGAGGIGAAAAFGGEVNKQKDAFDNCALAYAGNPGLIDQCQEFHKSEGEKYKTLTNAMIGVGSVLAAAGVALIVVGAIKLVKSRKGSAEVPPEKTKVTVVPTPLFTADSAYLGVTGTF